MKIWLTISLLGLSTFCLSQTTTPNIVFSSKSFKISFPTSWQLDTTKNMGAECFIFSPLENEKDNFRENVNVMIQDLSGSQIDLEKYKQITEQQLKQYDATAQVFESSIIKQSGGNFYKVLYSMTQNKNKLKITSVCFIKNEKAYLITLTTKIETYEKYKKIGEDILNSFSL